MTDLFLQIGLSNAAFSLGLAIAALLVGKYAKRPHLAHLLWLLVFVKLITPPLVTIPVETVSRVTPAATEAIALPEPATFVTESSPVIVMEETPLPALPAVAEPKPQSTSWTGTVTKHLKSFPWLPHLWILGALSVLLFSLVRVFRFNRLLMADSKRAPAHIENAAKKIAHQLKLKTIPAIYTTSARISPMVWWVGTKVRVILPAMLLEQMESRQWKLVLAHELAHVKRKDHLVRWIEWLACVSFWWNPVAWWAQRNLRAMEEICCDALVLSSMQTKPQSYANSILTAVEYLSTPAIRPPAMASELNSGETLERRFRMIVSNRANRSKSRILQAFVMVLGLVVLPLGVASAQDFEAVNKRLKDSVKKGEITKEQANAMMSALKKSAKSNHDAVNKRLKSAVKAGELTAKQATAMMGTLKKGSHSDKKKGHRSDKNKKQDPKRKYRAIEEEIWAAVKAGKLSKEEAEKKLAALKKQMFGDHAKKDGDHDKKKVRALREKYAAIEKEIIAAARAGKITREEAGKEIAALKEKMFGNHDKKDGDRKREKGIDWSSLKKEIEGAVKKGDLTREEADGVYKIEKAVEDGELTRDQADMIYRIEGAVKEGKITRKQADERYRAKFGEDKNEGDHDRKGNNQEEGKRRRYYAAEQKIKKAVDEGKVSAEDAKKRLDGLRKALWPDKREESRKKDDPSRDEYIDQVAKRIKMAVEEGKITEEQGKQRMEGFLKRLDEKEREE